MLAVKILTGKKLQKFTEIFYAMYADDVKYRLPKCLPSHLCTTQDNHHIEFGIQQLSLAGSLPESGFTKFKTFSIGLPGFGGNVLSLIHGPILLRGY